MSALACQYAGRKSCTSPGAAGAPQPMALVFGHDRFGSRDFQDLMSNRVGVGASQVSLAFAATTRSQSLNVVALICQDQNAGVAFMSRLSTLLPGFLASLGFRLFGDRFGVQVDCAGGGAKSFVVSRRSQVF